MRIHPAVAPLVVVLCAPVLVVPVASAQSNPSTVTTTFACASTGGYIWDPAFWGTISPNVFTVSSPASVRPGEAFDLSIQPAPIPVTSDTGRISMAYQLPTNAAVLDIRNEGGDSGLVIKEPGWNLAVERVDAVGAPKADGTVVKISGGATVKFGGNEDNRIVLPQSQSQGLTAASGTTFRLPRVGLTLRAPSNASTGKIALELFAKGTSGASGNPANTFMASQQVTAGNKLRWCRATYPGSMTSTTIRNEPPVVVASRIALTSGPVTVADAESTTLRAQVEAPGAATTEVAQGTVTFRRTDTGAVLGTAKPGLDGSASVATAFTGTLAGYQVPVVAEYAGLSNSISPSSASPVTLSVAPNLVRYAIDVQGLTRGTENAGVIPVQVRAAVSRSAAGAYPAGLTAQLYRDESPVGSPVPVSAAGTYTFTDSLTRGIDTKTYYYSVRINQVVVGSFAHSGRTVVDTGVIIEGTSPGSPVQGHFVDGSVDSSRIFLDRERFLEIGAGSLTSVDILSSGR